MSFPLGAQSIRVYDVADFGLKAGGTKDASAVWQKMRKKIKAECGDGDSVVVRFHEGTYHSMKKVRPSGSTIFPITIRTIRRKWDLLWRT